MTDYSESVLLPKLLKYINDIGAKIRIEVEHLRMGKRHKALEDLSVDLNIHGSIEGVHRQKYGTGILQKFLFEDRYVFVMREETAPEGDQMSLEELSQLPHARFGVSRIIDQLMQQNGLERNVVLQVPHIMVLPKIVAECDLVITIPERLADYFSRKLPLKIVNPPVRLPKLRFYMYWHEKKAKSPSHVWFRNILMEMTTKL